MSFLWVGFYPSGCFGCFGIKQVLLKVHSCSEKSRIESNKNNNSTALKYWNIDKEDLQWICCNPFNSLRFLQTCTEAQGIQLSRFNASKSL